MALRKLVHPLGNTAMLLYRDTCSQSCTQQLGSRSSALLFLYLPPDCFSMACTWCSPINSSDDPAHDSLESAPLSFIPSTERTSTLFPQGPKKCSPTSLCLFVLIWSSFQFNELPRMMQRMYFTNEETSPYRPWFGGHKSWQVSKLLPNNIRKLRNH